MQILKLKLRGFTKATLMTQTEGNDYIMIITTTHDI